MTRGARMAPLLVAFVFLSGGAAAHDDRDGAGVSATAACTSANEKVAAAKKAVKRAKRALRRAETRRAKVRARRKLKKAKRRLANAIAEKKKACATPQAPVPTSPPPAPQLGGTSPGSTSNSNNVTVKGTAQSGTTVKLFSSANCAGAPVATGSAAQFGSGGLPVTVPDNSTTTFRGTATNAGGTSPCSPSSVSYTEDSLAPAQPTFTGSSPASPADDTSPEITGTAEPGSTVTLYNDPACASTPSSTGPAEAFGAGGLTVRVPLGSTTTFRATATDQAGNTSPCSSNSIDYVQQPPNQPPSFGAQTRTTTVNNQYTIVLGQVKLIAHTAQITLSPGATDPDGDPLTYTWEASNGTITGAGLSATWVRVVENYLVVPGTVTVTASDGRGGFATYTF